MIKDHTVFLKHILECIEAIEQYSRGLSERQFLKSQIKQDAIIRRLEVIGEAVKNLPENFKEKHSDIPWNKAMATRNIIVHDYLNIDLEIIWDTVKESLPGFKEQIESLL